MDKLKDVLRLSQVFQSMVSQVFERGTFGKGRGREGGCDTRNQDLTAVRDQAQASTAIDGIPVVVALADISLTGV